MRNTGINPDPVVRLRNAGSAMYGDRWQTPLAVAMGVDRKTIFRWLKHGPPGDINARLAAACRWKAGILKNAASEMIAIAKHMEKHT